MTKNLKDALSPLNVVTSKSSQLRFLPAETCLTRKSLGLLYIYMLFGVIGINSKISGQRKRRSVQTC